MPYPIAHPAAVLPLAKLFGRYAVPSALVIGSMVPDLWYVVPLAQRAYSHSFFGLFWFCLPAGLLVYAAFHLLVKQPALDLLPRALAGRLAPLAKPVLPDAPWAAVAACLVAGAATHVGWDALVHGYELHGRNFVQHFSTLLGTGIVAFWCWKSMRGLPVRAPRAMSPNSLSAAARAGVLSALLAAAAAAGLWSAPQAALQHEWDIESIRLLARTVGLDALSGFLAALLAYCALRRMWLGTR